MLVLSRKEMESVVLEGVGKVVVLSVKSNRVTLGIEADREVSIRRGEVEPKEEDS